MGTTGSAPTRAACGRGKEQGSAECKRDRPAMWRWSRRQQAGWDFAGLCIRRSSSSAEVTHGCQAAPHGQARGRAAGLRRRAVQRPAVVPAHVAQVHRACGVKGNMGKQPFVT